MVLARSPIMPRARTPWIQAIHRRDRGFRKSGGGVVDAFYDGFEQISDDQSWEFIVKLDGDLSFSPDYFQRSFEEFERDANLGIGGGKVYIKKQDTLVVESPEDPAFHVRGATKIYRRACWNALGGLLRTAGWDTMDEVKANMLDWKTRTFPSIMLQHHRFTGAAEGAWRDSMKNGMGSYILGYHPFFMTGKCLVRLFRRPYLVASCGLMFGFLSGYLKQVPQIQDKELICYLRRQQLKRMFGKPSTWR